MSARTSSATRAAHLQQEVAEVVSELQQEVASLKHNTLVLEDRVAQLQAENDALRAQAAARDQCATSFMQEWSSLGGAAPEKLAFVGSPRGAPAPPVPTGSAPQPPMANMLDRLEAIEHQTANDGAESRSYEKLFELRARVSDILNVSGISIERAFRAFDTNHDGCLDRVEVGQGLAHMAGSSAAVLSAQDIDDMFTMLDKDGDGSVDLIEFSRWFGNGPPPAPALPEVAMRVNARASSGDWLEGPDDHLKAIKKEVMTRKLRQKKIQNMLLAQEEAAAAAVPHVLGKGLRPPPPSSRPPPETVRGALIHWPFKSV